MTSPDFAKPKVIWKPKMSKNRKNRFKITSLRQNWTKSSRVFRKWIITKSRNSMPMNRVSANSWWRTPRNNSKSWLLLKCSKHTTRWSTSRMKGSPTPNSTPTDPWWQCRQSSKSLPPILIQPREVKTLAWSATQKPRWSTLRKRRGRFLVWSSSLRARTLMCT